MRHIGKIKKEGEFELASCLRTREVTIPSKEWGTAQVGHKVNYGEAGRTRVSKEG